MRCVVQKVTEASVRVDGETVGQIGPGFMILIGVSTEDTEADVRYMAEKVPNLRLFEDVAGKLKRSRLDVGADIGLRGRSRRKPSIQNSSKPGGRKGSALKPGASGRRCRSP